MVTAPPRIPILRIRALTTGAGGALSYIYIYNYQHGLILT